MIEINVTQAQVERFATRGFPIPEVTRRGDRYLAFTVREDGQWVEFLGHSPNHAVEQASKLVVQRD